MKYCCEKFESYVQFPNTTAPNIRVVKFEPVPKYGDGKSHYAFYVTMGYEQFSLKLPTMMISFCPFCATDLKRYYKSDEYVNEFEGKTFPDSY